MARKNINVGTGPNSNDGDVLRSAFVKTNENFIELYLYNQNISSTIYESTAEILSSGNHNGINLEFDSSNQTITLTGFSGDYNDLINTPVLNLDGGSPSEVYVFADQLLDGGIE